VAKDTARASAENHRAEGKKVFSIPLSLIVVDGVGAMLVAWGFYLYISESRGLFHIGAGFLLMAPLIIHLLKLRPSSAPKKG